MTQISLKFLYLKVFLHTQAVFKHSKILYTIALLKMHVCMGVYALQDIHFIDASDQIRRSLNNRLNTYYEHAMLGVRQLQIRNSYLRPSTTTNIHTERERERERDWGKEGEEKETPTTCSHEIILIQLRIRSNLHTSDVLFIQCLPKHKSIYTFV